MIVKWSDVCFFPDFSQSANLMPDEAQSPTREGATDDEKCYDECIVCSDQVSILRHLRFGRSTFRTNFYPRFVDKKIIQKLETKNASDNYFYLAAPKNHEIHVCKFKFYCDFVCKFTDAIKYTPSPPPPISPPHTKSLELSFSGCKFRRLTPDELAPAFGFSLVFNISTFSAIVSDELTPAFGFSLVSWIFFTETRHPVSAVRPHLRLPPVLLQGQEVPLVQGVHRRQEKGDRIRTASFVPELCLLVLDCLGGKKLLFTFSQTL
jgi:hypothetical protein